MSNASSVLQSPAYARTESRSDLDATDGGGELTAPGPAGTLSPHGRMRAPLPSGADDRDRCHESRHRELSGLPHQRLPPLSWPGISNTNTDPRPSLPVTQILPPICPTSSLQMY